MISKILQFIVLFSLLAFNSMGQIIDVGIFTPVKLKRVIVTPESEGCAFYGDGVRISELYRNDGLQLQIENGKISLKSLSDDFGLYHTVEFRGLNSKSVLNVKGIDPVTPGYPYTDRIKVRIFNGSLQLVNRVNIENYVGGVVEAEAGKERPVEYYKVQSIISRTYALTNFRRHIKEGFQLCDQVHCQVYHGKTRFEPLIPVGVVKTKGIVLVDSEITLITASFSSNCGGKTRNSEEVWSRPLGYLKAVSDTFCLNGDHATWEKTIDRHDWESYKKRNTIDDSFKLGKGAAMDDTFSEFLYGKQDLNAIRTYFKLNSTRFVIVENTETVTFLGQGFGHGVGLCQEGAIRMSALCYSYKEILEFYYTDVHLIQLLTLDFFKSD
jgi:stage II sporulation protein D